MKKIITTICLFIIISTNLFAQIIDGYTDKQSYRANDVVTFFINGGGSPFNIPFRLVDMNNNVAATFFTEQLPQTANTYNVCENGFGYVASATTFTIPSSLKSGFYFVENDPIFQSVGLTGNIPLIVKGDNNIGGADIVVVCSSNTDEAYDDNGGNDMYGSTNNNVLTPGSWTSIATYNRPLSHLSNTDGFLTWLDSNYPVNGHTINVISDVDMDDYTEIENAKLLIVIGHSEYWTRQARLNFDRFVDDGHDAMVLSGNTMWWQVRYQTDPNDAHNPQMVCYRGDWGGYQINGLDFNDPIMATDALLETTSWDKPSLKYSQLSSIGSNWENGKYCEDDVGTNNVILHTYPGFHGYKITLPNSPLMSGTGLGQGSILTRTSQDVDGEMDGTLIKRDLLGVPILDANNDPILDVEALGFYKAEMIAYDKPRDGDAYHCAPILAFQKTCNSGKIINVNSNYWCRPSHFNQPNVKTITDNMIKILLGDMNNGVVWDNPSAPKVFSLKPGTNSVSYSACRNGTISITPCGVQMQNGYKMDNANGVLSLGFDANCQTYQALRLANNINSSSTVVLPVSSQILQTDGKAVHTSNPNAAIVVNKFSIYPNPAKSTITLNFPTNQTATLTFTDMLGNEVLVQNATVKMQSDNYTSTELSIAHLPKGIYFVTAKTATQQFVSKLVKE